MTADGLWHGLANATTTLMPIPDKPSPGTARFLASSHGIRLASLPRAGGTHLQHDGKLLRWAPVLYAHREPHLERRQLLGKERAVLWVGRGGTG